MILSLIYTSQFLFCNFIYYKNSEYQASYLRKYIENMGPVFIKFGQLLSMHKYWLNNYQYRELAKLRDNVRVPYNIETIKKDLPTNLSIESKSISNGSIATVHLGKYNEKEVIIKVKRDNIETQIKNTLFYWEYFAYFSSFIPVIKKFNFYQKFKILKRIVLSQCDFITEIESLQSFKKSYSNLIKIPKVYPEVSNNNFIVMEYLPGISMDNMLETVTKDEKKEMIKIFYGFLVSSINIKGLFHCDLHSGNFSWKKENGQIQLILYDFGMVGKLSPDKLTVLNNFYYNLITKNLDKTIESLNNIIIKNNIINESDNKLFNFELRSILIDKFKNKQIQVIGWISEIIYLVNKYDLTLHDDFTDFELATICFEGVLMQLSSNDQEYIDLMKEILL
jgi:ubiquinone biosynthesis protein